MSGPVWRYEKGGSFFCDECLRQVDEAMLEGEIFSSNLQVERTLCQVCYDKNYHFLTRRTDKPNPSGDALGM